jgi:GNAT superfamily N-acetyltransferase
VSRHVISRKFFHFPFSIFYFILPCMNFRIRQGSPTDGPTLMHIEHSCRAAASFLPEQLREPGQVRPRIWRSWILCSPPYDRHPTPRALFVAYDQNDVGGFVAVMHDSLFAGYHADIAGLFVLPRWRRKGIGRGLLGRAALWLSDGGLTRFTIDCFAGDSNRAFLDRQGGVVISSTADPEDRAAIITYGFSDLRSLVGLR